MATIIRPKMECAEIVWSPHKKKHKNNPERMQRMAMRTVPELEGYEERLKEMDLPTLEQRGERGDLIQT